MSSTTEPLIAFSARSEALLHWAADEFGDDKDGFHNFLQEHLCQVAVAGVARLGDARTYVIFENCLRLVHGLMEAEA